ncbi:MAG: flagellar basal-body rod protein FlgG [Methylohalobius sp. ZOD2]|uniref:flagellar basal-body rod protein FlgG n=1 Tax=Methylohalobius crimeensis TaxID=244365 RepID=UPI0003B4BE2B|nr:flagellar basal-body rod protein FlgG [Methylohalobius crimeensis]
MTDRALWVAKTGLDAQQTRMAVTSNNLANVNTTGFKKSRALFEDLLYQNVRQVGAQSSQNTELPSGLQLGTGVKVVATEKLHTQGNIVETGNPLDVAIEGRGFFQVLMPNGDLAYTRNGSFKMNAEGQLVTANGYFLEPAITVPSNATSLTIGRDGIVSASLPGTAAPQQLGQLQLASFVNPTGLEPVGENLFRESMASGTPTIGNPSEDERGALVQHSLETSNVNVVEEMVNMIETQRAYEMTSKAISTTDQMLAFVTNNL